MPAAVFILIAYLIGSLSFAVMVSRAFGLPDPRTYGSGNPGATNVLRTGRMLAALLTLAGDAGKGWLAVVLAQRFAAAYGVDATGVAACAAAVFFGHLFALFFRYSSLAAIVSAVFAPAYAFFMSLLGFDLGSMLPAVVLTSALLVWRHKSNILNLVAGRERRIGEKRD